MPTDDVQVLVVGQESTPAAYVIPGNGQITPRSVFAHYNGTGAAGSFVPALKVISDGGETVGIYPSGQTLAAGASADVSWFPGVGGQSSIAVPGEILQQYFGNFTATDFTWTAANTEKSSGYPVNSTFTKISGTSLLFYTLNGDFSVGTTVPNVCALGLFIDGGLEENIFHHVGIAGVIASVAMAKYSAIIYGAGAHTLDCRVWFLNAGGTWTARTSSAFDLTIMEIQPV